jgi:O-antigen ligase
MPLVAILLQGAGLGITGSRGGILALGVSSMIFVVLIPRRKLTLSAMVLMVFAIVAAAVLNPAIMARIESLRTGLLTASGGIREYLWRSGMAMVRDHPLAGVGVGAFGVAFTTIYPYFNPYSTFYVSLSHTAVLTVLAETGFVGFTVLYFLFGKTLLRGWDIFRTTSHERLRFLSASTVAGIIAIFVSAQGEGRLYEEPLLWVLWAMLVSVSQLANIQTGKELKKL